MHFGSDQHTAGTVLQSCNVEWTGILALQSRPRSAKSFRLTGASLDHANEWMELHHLGS